MAKDYMKRLAQKRKRWRNTPAATGGIQDRVPQGTYQCEITKAQFTPECRVNWQMKIIRGEFAGKTLASRSDLLYEPDDDSKPDGLAWFKGNLEKLGLTLPELDPKKIKTVLKKALGLVVECFVTHTSSEDGRVYQNAYFNGLVNAPDEEEEEEEEEELEDEEDEEEVDEDEDEEEADEEEDEDKEEEDEDTPFEEGDILIYEDESGKIYQVKFSGLDPDDSDYAMVHPKRGRGWSQDAWSIPVEDLEKDKEDQPVELKKKKVKKKGKKKKLKEEPVIDEDEDEDEEDLDFEEEWS